MEILYEAFIKERPVAQIVTSLAMTPDAYAVTLARAAEEHRISSDERIAGHLRDWTLERLALVDRLIMEMALGELALEESPPAAVVLNEAVELAHDFSTEGSPSFVNGVLAACISDA